MTSSRGLTWLILRKWCMPCPMWISMESTRATSLVVLRIDSRRMRQRNRPVASPSACPGRRSRSFKILATESLMLDKVYSSSQVLFVSVSPFTAQSFTLDPIQLDLKWVDLKLSSYREAPNKVRNNEHCAIYSLLQTIHFNRHSCVLIQLFLVACHLNSTGRHR